MDLYAHKFKEGTLIFSKIVGPYVTDCSGFQVVNGAWIHQGHLGPLGPGVSFDLAQTIACSIHKGRNWHFLHVSDLFFARWSPDLRDLMGWLDAKNRPNMDHGLQC